MAVTEDSLKIARFRRAVLRREQLRALLDALSLVILAGGLISAAVALYVRLKPVSVSLWAVVVGIFGALAVGSLIRWYVTRATTRDAAFLIDDRLDLEDRIVTAQAIEERGGPDRAVEMALVQDAAARLSGARPAAVVPFSLPKAYALRLVGVIALIAALLIPERSLPGGQALVEAREDIQTAGEQLEQTSTLIQQNLPPETETAQLAKEQAELGNSLRRSNATRAEALQKLSALEDRIRQRHDQLESTRADEIVALAERRLRSALAALPKQQANKAATEAKKSIAVESKDDMTAALKGEKKDAAANEQTAKDTADKAEVNPSEKSKETEPKSPDTPKATEAEPDKEVAKGGDKPQKSEPGDPTQAKPQQDKATDAGENPQQASPAGDSPANAAQNDSGEKPKSEDKGDKEEPQNPLSGLMAEQAAKALPALSEQLLKQAEQLRLEEIKPEDIQRLQQAAQVLMRDLERIAQSKEFQQALEQMARQINPEQIERVARQLMSQEKLRAELESAARLWAENRQAKEIVSGLARKLDKLPTPPQQRGNENLRAGNNPGGVESGQPGSDGKGYGRGPGSQGQGEVKSLTGKGREVKVGGNPQRGAEGEYLYLQARPGVGAARAPYTSAYPQYRREAERSVERSQVPAHLRSVVRNYFDAINPDARKQN